MLPGYRWSSNSGGISKVTSLKFEGKWEFLLLKDHGRLHTKLKWVYLNYELAKGTKLSRQLDGFCTTSPADSQAHEYVLDSAKRYSLVQTLNLTQFKTVTNGFCILTTRFECSFTLFPLVSSVFLQWTVLLIVVKPFTVVSQKFKNLPQLRSEYVC